MRRSRLRRLRRSGDVWGRIVTTETRHDTKYSRGVFGGVSDEADGTGDVEGNRTATGTWESTCGRSADNLSSCQKTEERVYGKPG